MTRVVVDNRRDYQRILDFIDEVMPRWRPRVELYDLVEPIFERYGIEAQIAKALERKVWLKSGGYIVIDHTEALTAIDVNTGRFVGKTDHHETALRTNLEAARVIVDQLRLRNIGGLIIIDFIDMENAEHRKAVLSALTDALKADKARANIVGLSELGLVEMTRQRTRESLGAASVRALPDLQPARPRQGRRHDRLRGPAPHPPRGDDERARAADRRRICIPPSPRFLAHYEPAALRELERELSAEIVVHQTQDGAPAEYSVTAVVAQGAAESGHACGGRAGFQACRACWAVGFPG